MSADLIKQRIKELNSVIDQLNVFDGEIITKPLRVELTKFLKTVNEYGFTRVDKNNSVILKLNNYSDELAEVIFITDIKGKFYINMDRLFKVIYSLQEQLQEINAYMD